MNAVWYEPISNSTQDRLAAQRALSFFLNWFLDPIIFGNYPEEMKDILGSLLPEFSNDSLGKLKNGLDFIGINHYTSFYAKDCLHSTCEQGGPGVSMTEGYFLRTAFKNDVPIGESTAVDWLNVYPEGMEKMVTYLKHRYNNTPMYITENGFGVINAPDTSIENFLNDDKRVEYMKSYLDALVSAIRKGADVRCYIAWSLLDNFEWLSGYTTRFGLYHMNTIVVNNSVFKAFFEKQRLTGPNFIDWYRNLWIALSVEDKLPFLEQPIPAMPTPPEGEVLSLDVLATHAAWVKAFKEIAEELRNLFAQQAEQELLQIVREFHACKHEEGQSVSSYILKIKSYIDNLERLDHSMSQNLAVSLILVSLRKEYDSFMQNYNMYDMGKTVTELYAMLKLHEQNLTKKDVSHALRAIRSGKVQKKKNKNKKPQLAARRNNQGKGKSKLAYAPKPKIPPPPKNENPAKDSVCHQCGNTGHWKRNCPQYLSELLKNKKLSQGASTSGIVTIELFAFPVSRNHVVYFSVVPRDGINEIDLSNSNTNDSSMYAVSNKRSKLNLDSSLLWHCRLRHISKKRIEKLQHDGLLTSTDIQSFEKCVSYLEIIQEEDTHPSENTSLHHDEGDQEIDKPQSDSIPICRSRRKPHAPDRMCLYINDEEYELGDLNEPTNYRVALLDPESNKWLDAMNVEMQSMKDHEVWDLVDLPPHARLVVKGFTQTYRVDYGETFSPVADIRDIRIFIAIATYYDYEIWKIDVKTAFLNGHLSEEVYMVQPEGVKSYLGKCFAIKDLGEAAYILGIKIYRDRSRWLFGLCQSTYNDKILKRFYMENSKRRSIPMQEKLKLSKFQGASTPAEVKRMQNVPYAYAMGSIMYVMRCTCPDVAFAKNITSRFQHNPGEPHRTVVKNILKYLRNTKDMFFIYEGDIKRELMVSCYTDVGYLTDVDDLKSQTGYVFVLNGGDVDWKSIKQSIFTTSSLKAEYIAALDASKEAVWVRKFISGLRIVPAIKEPIKMYCDNTRAITIANKSGITKGARHYRAKVHYLREVIEFGDVKKEKVHTDENLDDPFTKALLFPKHSEHTKNIGMLPVGSLI
nr:beta glucosidase 46 [Tanacetum cinerariifolium]